MSTLAVDTAARARHVRITRDELIVELQDGRTVSVPLAWFPKLLHATNGQRRKWELIGDGEGIRWPAIDEDLSVAGLLRGTPAPQAVPIRERRSDYRTRPVTSGRRVGGVRRRTRVRRG